MRGGGSLDPRAKYPSEHGQGFYREVNKLITLAGPFVAGRVVAQEKHALDTMCRVLFCVCI